MSSEVCLCQFLDNHTDAPAVFIPLCITVKHKIKLRYLLVCETISGQFFVGSKCSALTLHPTTREKTSGRPKDVVLEIHLQENRSFWHPHGIRHHPRSQKMVGEDWKSPAPQPNDDDDSAHFSFERRKALG